MKGTKPILLVEDDQVDVMSVQRIFKNLHITNPLDIAEDGEKALAWLKDPQNHTPCIILLDINLPRMNGIEFLQIIKQDDGLKRIPVVVLTTSEEEQDKIDSFNLGVAGYMLKPPDYRQFVEVVRTIDYYWTVSELPNEV